MLQKLTGPQQHMQVLSTPCLTTPMVSLLTITNLPVSHFCVGYIALVCLTTGDEGSVSLKRQEPMPQLHSIMTQKTCILTTAVSIPELANTSLTRMQVSVCP